MQRHRCKVCFRSFVNGSALGGHMRSHMKNFYSSKQEKDHNPFEKTDDFRSSESYSSVSSQYLSEKDDGSKEDGVDPEFSSVWIRDSESDTDSSKDHSVCRRSKRRRGSRTSGLDGFGINSFSGFKKSKFGDGAECSASPEEEVAYCLMMLSRDKWKRGEKILNFSEEKLKLVDAFCGDSDVFKVKKGNKVRGKYKCEVCNKLFRSYQALGGHMANHKKIKHSQFNNVSSPEMEYSGGGSVAAVAAGEEKVHECPFCDRVFVSGQALGGHKRSHFAVGTGRISRNVRTISPVESITRNGENLKIDLNLPAPFDGDEDEMSQIAVSVVLDS